MEEENSFESLSAFRPNWQGECQVCGQGPTVSAVDLCGPCTWGESDTANGAWWDEEHEQDYQKAKRARAKLKRPKADEVDPED